jgi:GNAT superfamily N-acetyltransferase/transcriptional regulator with XRE-family HTH domain
MDINIRLACAEDIPALTSLIPRSVRALQAQYYPPAKIEAALGKIFSVDRQLIQDGTYFVAEQAGAIIGCGGWSLRETLYGSDHSHQPADHQLDPRVDYAKIRAFFVHPDWARKGIGSQIMWQCEAAALAAGFTRIEIVSTLVGEPFYQRFGYRTSAKFEIALSQSSGLPVVRMVKYFAGVGQADYTDRLQTLMGAIGIKTYAELCQRTGVTEKVIRRLRRGSIAAMQIGTLQKIAQGLAITGPELLATFSDQSSGQSSDQSSAKPDRQAEYDRLQTQLQTQRTELFQEFQQSALQTLESWMLQWPTAAHAAQQNPTAPAVKLLLLLRPVENLLAEWGIEPIGQVGTTIAFDPQQHQVMGAMPNPGDPVRVRYVGYRQADRLIHRAKVSSIPEPAGVAQ